jgi:hypothetical protein
MNRTLFIKCNTYGNIIDSLPTYEWALRLDVADPFARDSCKLSFGSEEIKSDNKSIFCAVGAEYTGPKQDWASNPWDQAIYYPTFTLSDSTGVKTEQPLKSSNELNFVDAFPNPLNPNTVIRFSIQPSSNLAVQHARIIIYDAKGRAIRTLLDKSLEKGVHEINFDGKDFSGEKLSTGIYLCRISTNSFKKTIKLIITE